MQSLEKWQERTSASETYSLIHGRNRVVLKILRQTSKKRKFLDVGCGTGQLVREASQLGHDATGIDFSRSMINICEGNKNTSGDKSNYISTSFLRT